MPVRTRLLGGTAIALILGGGVAAANTIGVASSVERDVRGDVAGVVRPLSLGDSVSQNEMIETGDESAAQLLFRDRTSVTLGENARLTLNRFVYDPDAGAGAVVAEATKGAFRFVSGLAGAGNYEVRTPRVTIGIRGSIVEGYIDEETGAELYVLVQGLITVCLTDGRCVDVERPGDFLLIRPDGSIVGPSPWTGPMLNLNVGANFVRIQLRTELLDGADPLPRTREANEVLDAERLFDDLYDDAAPVVPPTPSVPPYAP